MQLKSELAAAAAHIQHARAALQRLRTKGGQQPRGELAMPLRMRALAATLTARERVVGVLVSAALRGPALPRGADRVPFVLVGEGVAERAAAVAATASHKVFAQRSRLVGWCRLAREALDGRWGQLQQLVALVGAHTSPRAPRLLGASETQEGALCKGDRQLVG